MNIIKIDQKTIKGLSVRTNNVDEFKTETAKIANLYAKFDNKVPVDYKNGARAYGVFYNYDAGENGKFTVLAGTDLINQSDAPALEEVTIKGGKYMVFSASGEVPAIVIDTWQKIWAYFASDDTVETRAYTTDFEYYKNQNEIEIHIAIK